MESMEYVQFSPEEQAQLATAIGAAAHRAGQFDQALEWFNKAVEGGSAQAMCNLAVMYQLGQGVEKDEEKVRELLDRAEALGEPAAADLRRRIQNGELEEQEEPEQQN